MVVAFTDLFSVNVISCLSSKTVPGAFVPTVILSLNPLAVFGMFGFELM